MYVIKVKFVEDKKMWNLCCFRVGILGDNLINYNTFTLSPLGVDNEDEENEGEDGEHKQGDNPATTTNEKATGTDDCVEYHTCPGHTCFNILMADI